MQMPILGMESWADIKDLKRQGPRQRAIAFETGRSRNQAAHVLSERMLNGNLTQ